MAVVVAVKPVGGAATEVNEGGIDLVCFGRRVNVKRVEVTNTE